VSGKPIVIGTIGSYTGFAASSLGSLPELVEGWVESTNAAGGINGYPVEVKQADDGGEPSKGLAAAKQLVESDGVMAIAGEASLTATAWEKFVDGAEVPVVGGFPYESVFSSDPNFYASGASNPATFYGLVKQAQADGAGKLAMLVCAEAPICAQTPPLVEKLTKLVPGSSLAYSTKFSASAPSYTAPCLAAKGAGATGVYIQDATALVQKMLDTCTQQGWTPKQYSFGGPIGPNVVKDPNAEGMTMIQYNIPLNDESTPGGKHFHESLEEYAPNVLGAEDTTDDAMMTWAGLELFRTAAEAAKITPTSTAADVKKGLYMLKSETLEGLAPPLEFTEGQPSHISCYFKTVIEAGAYTLPEGSKYQCVPKGLEAQVYRVAEEAAEEG
jgi:branched-chain amino acid transport system substrate-binding protein